MRKPAGVTPRAVLGDFGTSAKIAVAIARVPPVVDVQRGIARVPVHVRHIAIDVERTPAILPDYFHSTGTPISLGYLSYLCPLQSSLPNLEFA